MLIEAAIIAGGVIIGGGTLASMVYTVKEKQDALIERFGKYVDTVKSSGLHFKMPWHKVRKVPTETHVIKEKLETKTADDIFVTIPINMRIQIVDTKKFTYDANNPFAAMGVDVAAAVKQLASGMQFADLFKERESISHQVKDKVAQQIKDLYGIELMEVIVDQPQVTAELQATYDGRKASENAAVIKLNNARAESEAAVMRAEGRKKEQILDGEGVAGQRSAIFKNYAEQFNELAAKGLTPEMAHQTILLAMANDTLRDAAKHGNVIISNTNTTEMISNLQAMSAQLTKQATTPKPANDEKGKAVPAAKPPGVGNG